MKLSLRSHLLGAADPVLLARDLGMTPDPWQIEVLHSTRKRVHVNIHRQGGKTTTTAVVALHEALYCPNSLTLIVSPGLRQSQELFRKVLAFYRQLGKPVAPETENQLSLVLENGSRVIATPASEGTIRGYSVDLLIVDEAARVPDETYASVSPMVAVTKGRVIALSTPAGRRGWFYKTSKSMRWEHFMVTGPECPRLTQAELDDERDILGDLAYRCEYLCEFVDSAGAAFDGADVDALWSAGPEQPLAPSRREPVPRLTREQEFANRQARLIMQRGPRFNTPEPACRHGVSASGRCFQCINTQGRPL